MKQNELRIGNWVDWVDWNEKTIRKQVKGIHPIGNYLYLENGWAELSRCEPIPLTEEWLVRFGFEKNEDGELETESKPVMKWVEGNDNDWYILFQTYYGGEWNSAYYVKHVHQLQNLHFALTGEEL